MRRRSLEFLRWLVPFRWLLLALVVLAATGLGLRRMERFGGLEWGLTELAHIWLGWASMGLWVAYLAHHLARQWGSMRSIQRLLGVGVLAASGSLLLTGALLAIGMQGGPPAWARPLHHMATWALGGLLAVHARKAWLRLPRALWALVVGPSAER